MPTGLITNCSRLQTGNIVYTGWWSKVRLGPSNRGFFVNIGPAVHVSFLARGGTSNGQSCIPREIVYLRCHSSNTPAIQCFNRRSRRGELLACLAIISSWWKITPPVKVAVGPWLRRRAGLTLMALYREGRRNRDEGFLKIVVLRASRWYAFI